MSSKVNLKSFQKKIDSPLAKYNSAGQLFCVLCNTQVKPALWTGHVNGKAHKENLVSLKRSSGQAVKRPATEEFKVPVTPAKVQKVAEVGKEEDGKLTQAEEELKRLIGEGEKEDVVEEGGEEKGGSSGGLPAGFFDDPKEDAKARGMKFRDPQDLEWEKFVKEIATEDVKSSEIVIEEQENTAVDRELDHIEEQMAQWQRVIDLEKKAEEFVKRKKSSSVDNTASVDNQSMEIESEEEDDDYDEELDWRNKKR